jgi:hypothetical protein
MFRQGSEWFWKKGVEVNKAAVEVNVTGEVGCRTTLERKHALEEKDGHTQAKGLDDLSYV